MEDGAAYLAKFFQTSLRLPPPPQLVARNLIVDRVLAKMEQFGQPEDYEFQNAIRAWSRAVDPLGLTLRDAKRLLNLLSQYPDGVLRELNVADLLLLLTLRQRFPGLYVWLSYRKRDLAAAGWSDSDARGRFRDRLRPSFDVAIQPVPEFERPSAVALLERLAPQLSIVWGATDFVPHSSDDGSAGRHLRSASYFDRYFWFRVPPGEVPDAVRASLGGVLALPGSTDEVARQIADLRQQYNDSAVLGAIEAHSSTLTPSAASFLARAMARECSGLSDASGVPFFLGTKSRWCGLIAELIASKVAESERLDVAAECFEAVSLEAGDTLAADLRAEVRRAGVAIDLVAAMKGLVDRIRAQGAAALESRDRLSGWLWVSKSFGDSAGHGRFAASLMRSPEDAAKLVAGYILVGTLIDSGDQYPSELRREQYDDLIDKVDRTALRKVLEQAYRAPDHYIMWRSETDLLTFAAGCFLHMDAVVHGVSDEVGSGEAGKRGRGEPGERQPGASDASRVEETGGSPPDTAPGESAPPDAGMPFGGDPAGGA
ncbi:MAG: hypothetical protein H6806_04735 [Planctomycetes bacterium]|nr:hypothetical protein [Planctomycetota bacterium]